MSGFTRFKQILLPLLLSYSLNTVFCQEKVEGLTGSDVLLSCSFNETLPENVTVHWRDKDDNSVLDINIIKNAVNQLSHTEKFRGRVQSFPVQFRKGNFSIMLKKVERNDSGPYDCYIPTHYYKQRTILSISGKRVEGAVTPLPGSSCGAVATSAPAKMMLLSLFLCCVV